MFSVTPRSRGSNHQTQPKARTTAEKRGHKPKGFVTDRSKGTKQWMGKNFRWRADHLPVIQTFGKSYDFTNRLGTSWSREQLKEKRDRLLLAKSSAKRVFATIKENYNFISLWWESYVQSGRRTETSHERNAYRPIFMTTFWHNNNC